MIKYGAAKTREEKRRANFQKQIKALRYQMDINNNTIIGQKAGLGTGRIYKLWHEPDKMTSIEMDKLSRLFSCYGLTFDATLGGNANAAG